MKVMKQKIGGRETELMYDKDQEGRKPCGLISKYIQSSAQRGFVLYLSGLLLHIIERRHYCHTYTTRLYFTLISALLENTTVIFGLFTIVFITF